MKLITTTYIDLNGFAALERVRAKTAEQGLEYVKQWHSTGSQFAVQSETHSTVV